MCSYVYFKKNLNFCFIMPNAFSIINLRFFVFNFTKVLKLNDVFHPTYVVSLTKKVMGNCYL